MKKIKLTAISGLMALIVGNALVTSAKAQNSYREFLGSRWEGVPIARTPKYGIAVDTGGFEFPRWKREQKSERWSRNREIPEWLITGCSDNVLLSLECFTNRLWADEGQILRWVDEAWESSGGAYQSRIRPESVTVRVEAAPFYVSQTGDYRGAWSWGPGRVSAMVFFIGHHAGDSGYQDFVFKNETDWAFGIMLGQHG